MTADSIRLTTEMRALLDDFSRETVDPRPGRRQREATRALLHDHDLLQERLRAMPPREPTKYMLAIGCSEQWCDETRTEEQARVIWTAMYDAATQEPQTAPFSMELSTDPCPESMGGTRREPFGDLIERLTQERDALAGAMSADTADVALSYAAARAENERLKQALREIRQLVKGWPEDQHILAICRRALEGER